MSHPRLLALTTASLLALTAAPSLAQPTRAGTHKQDSQPG